MSLKKDIENFSHKEVDYTLIGCVLGDGSISNNTSWIRIGHTNPQRDYVEFKERLFKSMGLVTKSKYDFIKNTTFGEYQYSEVSVRPNNISRLRNKSLTYYIKRITKLGLLLWWLDDGSLTVHTKKTGSVCRFGYLNTQAFDYQQHLLLQKLFKEVFDLDTKIHEDVGGVSNKTKIYYRLYFNATNFRKFVDIVRDYIPEIPENMKYKFNMKYTKTRMKNSEELMSRYNFF